MVATVGRLQAGGVELPTQQSGFKLYKGIAYVVLHGTVGVLAVFRVRPDNLELRRMKRWPADAEKVAPAT